MRTARTSGGALRWSGSSHCGFFEPFASAVVGIVTRSSRPLLVLSLMAEGRSNKGIAEKLVVTVAAVERNVTSIFGKLGMRPATEDHRRVLAVLGYLRREP